MAPKKKETKQEEERGRFSTHGPLIKAHEMNSLGVTDSFWDPKFNKQVELLSQGEAKWYRTLWWDDDIIDLETQVKIESEELVEIGRVLGINPRISPKKIKTSDILITRRDGMQEVYSIKYDRTEVDSDYTGSSIAKHYTKIKEEEIKKNVESLYLEKMYWERKGVKFFLRFSVDANLTLCNNIRMLMKYYNSANVYDVETLCRHLIITKKINVDLESKIVEIPEVIQNHKNEIIAHTDLLKERLV